MTEPTTETASNTGGDPGGHEPATISARMFAFSIAGLLLLVVVSLTAMWGYERFLGSRRKTGRTAARQPQGVEEPVRVALEPDQRDQRLQYERRQRRLLNRYRWVGDDRRSARIPIERAMELIERRYRADKANSRRQPNQ